MYAERCDLCPASALRSHGVLRPMGGISPRRDPAPAGARSAGPFPVRGNSSLSRREWTGGSSAHHPVVGQTWLVYFLKGVALQSDDAVERIQRVDGLVAKWRQLLPQRQSGIADRALDLFVENPFWTVGGAARGLEVAFSTAQRAIDRLESVGVVSQVGDVRRNRVYCASEILDVLEGSLQLA